MELMRLWRLSSAYRWIWWKLWLLHLIDESLGWKHGLCLDNRLRTTTRQYIMCMHSAYLAIATYDGMNFRSELRSFWFSIWLFFRRLFVIWNILSCCHSYTLCSLFHIRCPRSLFVFRYSTFFLNTFNTFQNKVDNQELKYALGTLIYPLSTMWVPYFLDTCIVTISLFRGYL